MKDAFTKEWIISNAVEITRRYEKGVLTLRSLHYQLVTEGMTNDIQHYKRVVNAMIQARWDNIIPFDAFSDLDRQMEGETKYEETDVVSEVDRAKDAIDNWMNLYFKNMWENQPYYVEIFIEKKALQGVFMKPCSNKGVALGACKGYPSLTFLHDTYKRFETAIDAGKQAVIIYFGDYDPSGEDIPRSIGENLSKFGVEVEIKRIALMEHQVFEWNLPPAPAKETDTRTAKWEGLGQVELDAVKPEVLQRMCEESIEMYFDTELYDELLKLQEEERVTYRLELKRFVNEMKD